MLCYREIRHDAYWDKQGIRFLIKKFATKITTYFADKNDVFRVRKISYNMASKEIHNANTCVEVPNKKSATTKKSTCKTAAITFKGITLLCKIANV